MDGPGNRWTRVRRPLDRAVEDTPGPAAGAALTSKNGCQPGVDERKSRRIRVSERYDGGPVAALRRIAFLLERGREDTYKVKAFRAAAAAILPLPADEVAERAEAGTLTDLPGVGASTAKVIADAVRGVVPDRLAKLEKEHAGPLAPGRPRAPVAAARRPALPLRLVRRRLADRGDGVHRDRARPRVPRAHRPLAAAHGGPRPEPGAAHPAARGGRGRQRAPRRQPASPCSRGSRSTSSTTARSTRPTSCCPGSTSGSPACTPS